MHQPPQIVLTGGVASGKSLASRCFAKLGVPIIDADVAAREVVAPGTPLLDQLLREFQPLAQERLHSSLTQANGQLDRALLRQLVFADPPLRRRLEALLHPAIATRMTEWSQAAGGRYQIHAIPLLTPSRAQDFDRVLVIDCPESLQLSRLIARDNIDPALAKQMLEAQMPRTERLALADDVICNDGTVADLEQAVGDAHERYLGMTLMAD